MNKMIRTMVILTMALFCSAAFGVSVTLQEVRQYIDDNNLDWVAAETNISKLSDEEFNNLCGLVVPENYVEPPEIKNLNLDPFNGRAAYDWRDHNGVTSVKDQGNCGSCWAFCTTGMVESFILIYDYNNWDLSEQQLVSCNDDGYGCGGGWIYPQYYVSPGGIFESCMPYEASDSVPCTENQCEKVAFIDDWTEISSSVNSIKNALVDGPVAVAMYVRSNFSYYSGGCYIGGSSSSVNHGVLIVGYDDAECSNQGAWIVKNSWGPSWGDNGFFKIKYGDSNIGYGATRVYYTPQGSVNLGYASHTISDSLGNNDGIADPGETCTLRVTLGNSGTISATGIGALTTISNVHVLVNDNFASFPDIPAWQQRESLSPHFNFTLNPQITPGSFIQVNLNINSNEGNFTDSFSFQVGDAVAPTWTPLPPTNTPQPTSTGAPPPPTNTPIPSWTPQPTSTAGPGTNTPVPSWTPAPGTFTPTPEPTDPQEPTFTPSNDPTETPQSTYSPIPDALLIELALNKSSFQAKDPFILTLKVNNPGPAFMSAQYIALQVNDSFWFWPSWSEEIDKGIGIYESGITENTILAIQWPSVSGQLSGLRFYGVLCNPMTSEPMSNLAMTEFSYTD